MAAAPTTSICCKLGTAMSVCSAIALASCASPVAEAPKPKRSKEYFAESEYGVKASPRVSNQASNLPRGGGRDQTGKPYQVKGKWYRPKEDPSYRNSGLASWYGDAFHGRLTANGEIYDMTHLTAAHPTMPLPSYARVTNKLNGHSLVVRVNDRGPYAHGRVIDLSRRAAELLDYTHHGVASVDVEYIGRAPLHGQDDAYLMASYRPHGRKPDPSDGMPTGVMIAMNGPTPTQAVTASAAFAGALRAPSQPPVSVGEIVLALPDIGPIAPERPTSGLAGRVTKSDPLAYADARVQSAASVALAELAGDQSSNAALIDALNQRYAAAFR